MKQELLEGQQTHFPLYLLSYVNKSVGELQVFIDSLEQGSCICSWYELSVLQLSEFTGSHNYIYMYNSISSPCQKPYPK